MLKRLAFVVGAFYTLTLFYSYNIFGTIGLSSCSRAFGMSRVPLFVLLLIVYSYKGYCNGAYGLFKRNVEVITHADD